MLIMNCLSRNRASIIRNTQARLTDLTPQSPGGEYLLEETAFSIVAPGPIPPWGLRLPHGVDLASQVSVNTTSVVRAILQSRCKREPPVLGMVC